MEVPELSYQLKVTLTERYSDTITTTTMVKAVPLVDGPLATGENSDAKAPMVSGNLAIDTEGGTALADLIVCHPRVSVCQQISHPKLSFAIGKSAVFFVAGPRFDLRLELGPEKPEHQ